MNIKSLSFPVALLSGMLFAQGVIAESGTQDAASYCKTEASENEVPANEMREYLAACLADSGVEAAEAESILKTLLPSSSDTAADPEG